MNVADKTFRKPLENAEEGNIVVEQVPLVTVIMLAYNHEAFIQQAIDGVLSQITSFAIELIIAEDCSTDGTLIKALEAQARNPDLIKVRVSEHNVGMHRNFERALTNCTTEFFALCEADDFWTDPMKLQKQFDLLKATPSAAICFHDVREVNAQGDVVHESKTIRILGNEGKEIYAEEDFLQNSFIPTLSVLCRNSAHIFGKNYLKVGNPDTYLFCMLGSQGNAVRIPGVMASYRRHDGGVWSSMSTGRKFWAQLATRAAISLDIDEKRRPIAVELLARDIVIASYQVLARKSYFSCDRYQYAIFALFDACFLLGSLSGRLRCIKSATVGAIKPFYGYFRGKLA